MVKNNCQGQWSSSIGHLSRSQGEWSRSQGHLSSCKADGQLRMVKAFSVVMGVTKMFRTLSPILTINLLKNKNLEKAHKIDNDPHLETSELICEAFTVLCPSPSKSKKIRRSIIVMQRLKGKYSVLTFVFLGIS